MSSVKIVEAGRALTLSSLVCSPLAETLLASSSSFSSNEEGTGLRGNRKSAALLRGEGEREWNEKRSLIVAVEWLDREIRIGLKKMFERRLLLIFTEAI